MNVVSLFDGISCGLVALKRGGHNVANYYASEIDKYAIQVSEKNHPEIIRLGDVRTIDYGKLLKIDLLLAGSPCQGFSFAGKQLNFEDPRSALFFDFIKALRILKPKYFLLENVKMKREYQHKISELVGCEPIEINSALLSAQNRKRLYWTNIPGQALPNDIGINISDILENGAGAITYSSSGRGNGKVEERINEAYKAATLTKTGYTNRSTTVVYQRPHGFNLGGFKVRDKKPAIRKASKDNYFIYEQDGFRRFTRIEYERLQTLTDNYTACLSDARAVACIGNGWTVDVIVHILKGIKDAP